LSLFLLHLLSKDEISSLLVHVSSFQEDTKSPQDKVNTGASTAKRREEDEVDEFPLIIGLQERVVSI
jgi:hypothetical protein